MLNSLKFISKLETSFLITGLLSFPKMLANPHLNIKVYPLKEWESGNSHSYPYLVFTPKRRKQGRYEKKNGCISFLGEDYFVSELPNQVVKLQEKGRGSRWQNMGRIFPRFHIITNYLISNFISMYFNKM